MSTLILIIKDKNLNSLENCLHSLIDNTDLKKFDNVKVISSLLPNKQYSHIDFIIYENIEQINETIRQVKSEDITIINGVAKFYTNWYFLINDSLTYENIISPQLYDIDEDLFMSQGEKYSNFTFDTKFNIKDNKRNSSILSPSFITIKKQRLEDLGYLEESFLDLSSAIVEISMRHIISGGKITVVGSSIAVKRNYLINKADQLRITDSYFSKRSNYFAYFNPDKRHSRTDNLIRLSNQNKKIDIDDYFDNHLSELSSIHKLFSVANNKSIAVIGTGFSLDYIEDKIINSFDLLIGIDYVATMFDVDLVLTDRTTIVSDLRDQISSRKFVLPIELKDAVNGGTVLSKEVISNTYLFEYSKQSLIPSDLCPPFINFNDSVLTAVHLAMFMMPKSITVFGFDSRLIEGKSHTTRSEYYDDGKLLTNSTATIKSYEYLEYGFKELAKLAIKHKIPLLRYNHV